VSDDSARVGDLSRRGLFAALAAAGPVGIAVSGLDSRLDQAAPLSGQLWEDVGTVPSTVEGEYGPATVTYDEAHVPHVEADDEAAAYFAVGYAQAADRLAQMDLLRRRAGGTLAALVGEPGVENDRFKTKVDFRGGAEASRAAIADTETEPLLDAYVAGINAYIDAGPAGVEYGLLDAEPEPWSAVDTFLVGMELGWLLNGGFAGLRAAVKRQRLDPDTRKLLYPDQLGHGTPIVREETTATSTADRQSPARTTARDQRDSSAVDPALVDWLSQFEGPRNVGSNAWTVAGEHTASGDPILCNDPHLPLTVPPIWYQQAVTAGDVSVRGVAIPGIPFVMLGRTDHCVWGATNVGSTSVDWYDYETEGSRYRYRGEWRSFDAETRTVAVAGGTDREVTVRKTLHGPFLERSDSDSDSTQQVGMSWAALSGTLELQALHEISHASGIDEFQSALAKLGGFALNIHYADRDGHTLYQMTGKIPIRRVDGAVVAGDRVFDGSAGHGEWFDGTQPPDSRDGFVPYGQSTWDEFVPFESLPSARDPDYIASANQRVVDDPPVPLAQEFDSGFRARRIDDRLDALTSSEDPIDTEAMQALQTDTFGERARLLVPIILDASERIREAGDELPVAVDPWLDALQQWDYRLERESRAALLFARLHEYFRRETWGSLFEERDLDREYWPRVWVETTLPPDSDVFDGDRDAVVVTAMRQALEEIDAEGWETYGDYQQAVIDHPFGDQLGGLNYPRYPTGGSEWTVSSYSLRRGFGTSYRQVAVPGADTATTILAGGNSGAPFSAHYDDQLRRWADGAYRTVDEHPGGEPDITVEDENE
jgi:penicillin amidase